MKKILLGSLLFYALSFADTYEQFLQSSLSNSPYLKSASVEVDIVKEENKKLLRYENPSIGVDYSKYKSDDGYSIQISQPIRLWGVNDNKKLYLDAKQKSANVYYMHSHAKFIYDISLLYVRYAKFKMLMELASKEEAISRSIVSISQKKYEAGTISKKDLLQAELEHQMVEIKNQSLELKALQSFYELIKFAGMDENLSLDFHHDFRLENSIDKNPDIALLESQKMSNLAYADALKNSVEWISLDASYEKEPDQDISTLGLSVPLAIFSTKSQEKKIALLEAKKRDYLIKNSRKNVELEIKKLKLQREKLYILKSKNSDVLKKQEKLLQMFKSSYKSSKGNLLEFHSFKNRYIQTEKELILIKSLLNKNIIKTNYLQGAYNE